MNMWNVREALHSDIVRSLLYRKYLLWQSMNIPIEQYVHSYIKGIIDWIAHEKEKNGYELTKPEFSKINLNPDGPFKTR